MSWTEINHFDVDKEFPHLAHAPIVEAVIHWQVSASKSLDREELKKELATRFPNYSLRVEQHVEAALSASAEGVEARQRTSWGGFRLTSGDEKYICRFKPNAVVFSRLAPYENWASFVAEALRFWESFVELADPVSVDRLGVRFINQIGMKGDEKVSDLVHELPLPLESRGFASDTFFRQDLLMPDPRYRVSLARTVQPPQPPMIPGRSLIVDIDVFTATPTKVQATAIDERLREMRSLKNHVFFEFVRDPEKRFGGRAK
jgi:uncharacterized protein (TIGR04255 family)